MILNPGFDEANDPKIRCGNSTIGDGRKRNILEVVQSRSIYIFLHCEKAVD